MLLGIATLCAALFSSLSYDFRCALRAAIYAAACMPVAPDCDFHRMLRLVPSRHSIRFTSSLAGYPLAAIRRVALSLVCAARQTATDRI